VAAQRDDEAVVVGNLDPLMAQVGDPRFPRPEVDAVGEVVENVESVGRLGRINERLKVPA
jgi:hypothetical protein